MSKKNIGIVRFPLESSSDSIHHTTMPDEQHQIRHIVGVMTGTSIDGIDAALLRIEGRGMNISSCLIRHISRPLGPLAGPLRRAANQTPMTTGELATLAFDFGRLHVEVISELLSGSRTGIQLHAGPDLIAVHGQTVFHHPPVSWQLINPAPIEHHFSCPVFCDLRQADLAAGGQGAPITPLADWVMFGDEGKSRAIVNLGGFINVTMLPKGRSHEPCAMSHEGQEQNTEDRKPITLQPEPGPSSCVVRSGVASTLNSIHGFDLCPCNQLLDAIARDAFGYAYDEGGRRAASGFAVMTLVDDLLDFFRRQYAGQRSLGTGDEAADWVGKHLHAGPPADLAASAIEAIGRFLAESIKNFSTREYAIDEIILAGGGTQNLTLVKAIEKHTQVKTISSNDCGIPTSAREAVAMAILGAMRMDGVEIILPQATERDNPVPEIDVALLTPKLPNQIIHS